MNTSGLACSASTSSWENCTGVSLWMSVRLGCCQWAFRSSLYLAKTCCVLEGAGFEEPVPIAIGVGIALFIVPAIDVALGVGCLQSIPSAYTGDLRFN